MPDRERIKAFLETNGNLLKQNKVDAFLKRISAAGDVGELTWKLLTDTNINIWKYTDRILNNMFAESTVNDSFEIPNNVRRIGNEAFRDCTQLKHLFIPDSVVDIGNNAFEGCDDIELTTPRRSHLNKLSIPPNEVEWYKQHLKMIDSDNDNASGNNVGQQGIWESVGGDWYQCSICNLPVYDRAGDYEYCPHCGKRVVH